MKRGWEIKKLGDVCTLQRGFDLPTHSRTSGIHPLVSSNGITDRIDEYKVKGPGVVTGRSGSIGNIHFIEEDFWPLNTALYIKDFHDNYPRYIFYLLTQFDLSRFTSGAGVPTLNRNHVHDEEVLITTNFSEQKRIVATLDEAFAAIDKAKANTEKNLQNAKELFESYLQLAIANKNTDWEEGTLNEVAQIKPAKNEVKETLTEVDSVTFLPMEDLNVLAYEIKPTKERKLKDVVNSYTYFANDDVLLAKITPCFENGKVGIAKNLINGVGFGSSEYIVFRSLGKVCPEYLYYFLSRQSFRDEGSQRMTGAVGHKRVSKEFIEQYKISYPKSLNEQKAIVSTLNSLALETKKLEIIYQQKLDDLEELKKSLLQKAFNGELTEKNLSFVDED